MNNYKYYDELGQRKTIELYEKLLSNQYNSNDYMIKVRKSKKNCIDVVAIIYDKINKKIYKTILIECKIRSNYSIDFLTDGCFSRGFLIQKDKIDKMHQIKKDNTCKGFKIDLHYINILKDAVIIFDIDKIKDYNYENKLCNATTMSNKNFTKNKEVTYLEFHKNIYYEDTRIYT